jgi:hypothetical protein
MIRTICVFFQFFFLVDKKIPPIYIPPGGGVFVFLFFCFFCFLFFCFLSIRKQTKLRKLSEKIFCFFLLLSSTYSRSGWRSAMLRLSLGTALVTLLDAAVVLPCEDCRGRVGGCVTHGLSHGSSRLSATHLVSCPAGCAMLLASLRAISICKRVCSALVGAGCNTAKVSCTGRVGTGGAIGSTLLILATVSALVWGKCRRR